jgi:hypothetical protein
VLRELVVALVGQTLTGWTKLCRGYAARSSLTGYCGGGRKGPALRSAQGEKAAATKIGAER